MVQRVQSSLKWVEEQESLKKYLPQLRKMILLRVLKQMETVFSVMKLQNYEQLIEALCFERYEVGFVMNHYVQAERVVMEAGATGELHIRIDYRQQCIYFKPHIAEKDIVASSIYTLTKKQELVYLMILQSYKCDDEL